MARSPKELIELYWTEVWNNRNAEMIRELCADPILRHDPGSVTALSIEDQIARVCQQSERAQPYFEHEVLHADDTYVTSIWNMRTRAGEPVELCGIEVFKAKDGKFTDCWNSTYTPGRWGREGDRSVPEGLPRPAMIADPAQITTGWLQAMFQHAGVDAPRVSIVASAPIGHGNLAGTFRTAITYNANAADTVPSVICKLTSPIPQAVEIAQSSGAYTREVEVYRFLGETPPCNAPRAYWCEAGADGRTINLVLQDLSGRTRPGSQIDGCSVAEAEAVIEQLGRLHAAYWNDKRLDGAAWLYDRPSLAEATEQNFAQGADIFRARFTGRLDAACLDAMDRFRPHAARLTRDAPKGRTLIHGELRVDNVLFEDTDAGPVAWLIDWQFSDRGSPMFDAAYFMAGSLRSEDRKAAERGLLARHRAAIAAVDPTYTLAQAEAEYAACLPFALFTTVGAALAIPEGEHADRLLMTLISRNIDALRDWNAIPA